MKTSVERLSVADLKTVLPGLSKIVSRRSALPVLSCVKVIHTPDHTIRLQANNLEQIVTVRLQNPSPGLPGELLVPLEELATIAKRCSAEETIELSASDKETSITYPAAGTRIKKPLKHVGLDEFPPGAEVNTEPVQLDNAFKEALQQAFDCTSEDSGRYVLHGACLDVSKKEAHYVIGTDGRHIFSANSFLFDIPESIIVPPGKFLTWPGFVDDGPWTLRFQRETKPKTAPKTCVSPAWVRLDSDHWTYVSKPIEGNYPNWKQAVPPTEALKSHITLGEPGIKIILDALPLLPGQDDRDQPVTLEIKDEYLTLKARGKDDWTEIPIPAKVSGLPVSISMNRIYLAKALKFGLPQIDIQDRISPLVFSTKGRMLVVCPLRPPDAPKAPAAPTAPPTPSTAAPENAPVPQDTAAPPAATPSPTQQPASQPTPEPPTQERKEMPRTARTTAPERVSAPETRPTEVQTNGSNNGNGTNSAVKSLVDQVEGIKDGLKAVIRDLSTVADTVKQAEKEKKATEKEIEAVRTKLRQIQNVNI